MAPGRDLVLLGGGLLCLRLLEVMQHHIAWTI